MSTKQESSPPSRWGEYVGRAGAVGLLLVIVALMILPATALGQPIPATLTPVPGGSATATATAQTAPAITLSTSSALPGASITVNGVGFRASETADVTLNAQTV